ncbi:hypothetical protein CRG98_032423, partial [Punica granatum]
MGFNETDTGASSGRQVEALAAFLLRRYAEELQSICLASDPNLHYPLCIDFAELVDYDPPLAHLVFSEPAQHLPLFDDAAVWAHKVVLGDMKGKGCGVKKDCIHVRINICGSPLECPDDVIVTGIVTSRWSPDLKDVRCDLDPMLIANHI